MESTELILLLYKTAAPATPPATPPQQSYAAPETLGSKVNIWNPGFYGTGPRQGILNFQMPSKVREANVAAEAQRKQILEAKGQKFIPERSGTLLNRPSSVGDVVGMAPGGRTIGNLMNLGGTEVSAFNEAMEKNPGMAATDYYKQRVVEPVAEAKVEATKNAIMGQLKGLGGQAWEWIKKNPWKIAGAAGIPILLWLLKSMVGQRQQQPMMNPYMQGYMNPRGVFR